MSPSRRGGSDEGPGLPGAGGATLRGAVLVAVAVLVGFVLLAQGFENGFLPTESDTPTEEAAADDDEEPGDGEVVDEGATTTAATAPPTTHAPAEVRVQILNSTGPSGSAGAATTEVGGLGFSTIPAADAGDQAIESTVVYAAPGYEADAAAVASALGITAPVQPMPTPPPPPAPADANVVVILGSDFAPPA